MTWPPPSAARQRHMGRSAREAAGGWARRLAVPGHGHPSRGCDDAGPERADRRRDQRGACRPGSGSAAIGVGVAASGTRATYGAIVLTESRDVTGARGTMVRAVVSGDDVRWTWRGADPILQRHTAGLREFAVQRRIDRGPWMGVISSTAATSRTLSNVAGGHSYGFRVRARDRAGNVGPWSAELRVWVP